MTPKEKNISNRKILLALLILITVVCALFCACIGFFSSNEFHAPSGFTAIAGNMQITLSWSKESDSDKVLIRYDTSSYPASVTDGKLVYEGSGTSSIHTDVEYGKTYYYVIWSVRLIDGEWTYSNDKKSTSATPFWRGTDGEGIREYVEHNGARMVGADGEYIELINNPESHDPSWQELKQFLWQDKTDQQLYNDSSFVCADFAEMLHNNAENVGIRAAYVSIDLYLYSGGHALNAFNTTDKGMTYIDCTGTTEGDLNADKTVDLIKGNEYIPVSIFSNPGYESEWESMGIVSDIYIQW